MKIICIIEIVYFAAAFLAWLAICLHCSPYCLFNTYLRNCLYLVIT